MYIFSEQSEYTDKIPRRPAKTAERLQEKEYGRAY
jgi:hypothetical protein